MRPAEPVPEFADLAICHPLICAHFRSAALETVAFVLSSFEDENRKPNKLNGAQKYSDSRLVGW